MSTTLNHLSNLGNEIFINTKFNNMANMAFSKMGIKAKVTDHKIMAISLSILVYGALFTGIYFGGSALLATYGSAMGLGFIASKSIPYVAAVVAGMATLVGLAWNKNNEQQPIEDVEQNKNNEQEPIEDVENVS